MKNVVDTIQCHFRSRGRWDQAVVFSPFHSLSPLSSSSSPRIFLNYPVVDRGRGFLSIVKISPTPSNRTVSLIQNKIPVCIYSDRSGRFLLHLLSHTCFRLLYTNYCVAGIVRKSCLALYTVLTAWIGPVESLTDFFFFNTLRKSTFATCHPVPEQGEPN